MKHLLYLTIFLIACETSNIEGKKADEMAVVKSEKEKVLEIHDIAMEKMGEMVALKSELKNKLKSIEVADSVQILNAIQELELADKLMWDWMHGYKAQIVDTSSFEVSMAYLKEQKTKIDVVAEKIETSLKNGNEILKK